MAEKDFLRRNELMLALNFYLKLPHGKLHTRTSEIIHLANLIGRTADSVSMLLNIFAGVDPYNKQRGFHGLPGARKQVETIWAEFINNKDALLFESERILAAKEHTSLLNKFSEHLRGTEHLQGKDKLGEVKTRVNQNVFRQIVIANYSGKCAITRIDIPGLLLASHIIPWSKSDKERLNPENAICLSPLYDRAYHKGYIGITEKYEIILSPWFKKRYLQKYNTNRFASLSGTKIMLPDKYYPKKEFLQYHMDEIFKR